MSAIDRMIRIAREHSNSMKRNVQFLCHNLREGCKDACAQVYFARKNRHGAVAADRQPGIKRCGLRRGVRVVFHIECEWWKKRGSPPAEPNGKRAGGSEERFTNERALGRRRGSGFKVSAPD